MNVRLTEIILALTTLGILLLFVEMPIYHVVMVAGTWCLWCLARINRRDGIGYALALLWILPAAASAHIIQDGFTPYMVVIWAVLVRTAILVELPSRLWSACRLITHDFQSAVGR